MIKVIECIPTMSTGGAETMVKDYCALINKEKIEMQVIVLDHRYDSGNERELERLGIKVTYLNELAYGLGTNLNIFQKIKRTVVRYQSFRRIVLNEKPDIIHIHLLVGAYFSLLPLNKLNCRLVMTIHNVFDNYFAKEKSVDKKKYKEFTRVNRLVHKHNMTLIALHDSMNRELRNQFETDNVVTVNNGIDMKRFEASLYDRAAKRRELGIGEDEFVIGNVGRLHEQKNHELMLQVLRCLLDRGESVRLLLVGKGPLQDKINARMDELGIRDKVTLLANRADVPELMSVCDVFLFPSRWEGYGNVLLEAQCMGLNCVISDKVPECVQITNQIKILSLEDNIEKWADACIDFSPDNKEDVKYNRSDYDMNNCVKKVEELYCSLAAE